MRRSYLAVAVPDSLVAVMVYVVNDEPILGVPEINPLVALILKPEGNAGVIL